MKPVHVKDNTHIDLKKEFNDKDPKFQVDDYLRISGLVKKTDYDAKITEIEGKIPDVSSLATKTTLTTVENKIPSTSKLLKKADYNTKVTDIKNKLNNHNHDKYITTPEFNILVADVFNATIAQANLITKTDFDDKLSNLNRKITSNKNITYLLNMNLKTKNI